jgi:hypothetical protein
MEAVNSLQIPPLLVAVHCQSKSRAVGTIVRSASALGAKMLLLVGDNRVGMHGAFGSNQRIVILHFESWSEARNFIESRRSRIFYYGISPPSVEDEDSQLQSLTDVSFPALGKDESACFVVGGKAEPLSEEIRAFLDVPIKVDFPNPHFALRLKFEEVFAVAIHRYVSTMRMSKEGGASPFQACTWSGEKFVKDETVSTGGNGRRGISVSKLAKRAVRGEPKGALEGSEGCVFGGLGALMGESQEGDY